MARCLCAFVFVVTAVCFGAVVSAQDDKTLPTDDEVNLVLTQTERAIQLYRPLIDQEELQMGKGGAEGAAKDRHVLDSLELAVKAFRKNPQGFNGPLGFAFFECWMTRIETRCSVNQARSHSRTCK